MANYNSTKARFNTPKSRINHKYIDATLKDKQNTIDSNFGLMQQQVEKVLGQDFANPEDAEMLKNKVSDVLNNLQNTDSIKFDSKKARFVMQDALNEAAKDPEVLEQIANTKKIRAFQASIEDAKKKGLYHENNYQAAIYQSGLGDYMKSGEERNKNLGTLNYTPYYDVNKEISNTMKEIQETYNKPIKETKLDTSVHPPRIITTERRPLSTEEVENRARRSISDKAKYQMAIDGATRFGFSQEGASQYVNQRLQSVEPVKQSKLEVINKELSIDGISQNKKNKLQKRKREIIDYYDSIHKEYSSLIGKSPMAVGRAFQEDYLMDNLLPLDYGSERMVDIKIDEAFYKDQKLKLDWAEFKSKDNKRRSDIQKNELKSSNNSFGQLNDIEERKGVVLPQATEAYVDLAYKDMQSHIDTSVMKGDYIKNNFGDKYNEALSQIQSKLKKGEELIEKDPFLRHKEVIDLMKENNTFSAEENKMLAEYEDSFSDAHSRFENYNTNYKKAEEQEINNNYQNLYGKLTNTREVKNRRGETINVNNDIILLDKSGTPKNLSEVFKKNRVSNGEDLKIFLNTEDGAVFKANLLLSEEFKGSGGRSPKGREKALLDKNRKRKEAQELLGLDDNAMATYIDEYKRVQGEFWSSGYRNISELEDEIEDFNNIDKVSPDKLREARIRQYNNLGIKETDNTVLSIKGNSEAANYFKTFENLGIPEKSKESIFIRQDPFNKSKIEVWAKEEVETGELEEGQPKKRFQSIKKGSVDKSEIKSDAILNRINIMEEKASFDFNVKSNKISSSPKYVEKDITNSKATYLETFNTDHNNKEMLLESSLTTKIGVKDYLDSRVEPLKRGVDESVYKEAVDIKDFYLSNFSDFRLKLSGSKSIGNKISIVYKGENEDLELSSFSIPDNLDTKKFNLKLSSYPNVLLAKEMGRLITNYSLRNKLNLNGDNLNKILELKNIQND